MKCGAGNFQLQLTPNVRLQGLLRGKTWQSHVFPLNNPFGPSSLMPQSEMNPPAHLRKRRIKENLNYRVVITQCIKNVTTLIFSSGTGSINGSPPAIALFQAIACFIGTFKPNVNNPQFAYPL